MAARVFALFAVLAVASATMEQVSTEQALSMAQKLLADPTAFNFQEGSQKIFDMLDTVKARLDAQLGAAAQDLAAKKSALTSERDERLAALKKTYDAEVTAATVAYDGEVQRVGEVVKAADARLSASQELVAGNTTALAKATKAADEAKASLAEKRAKRDELAVSTKADVAKVREAENRRYDDGAKDYEAAYVREKAIIDEAKAQSLGALENEEQLVAQIKMLLANLNKDKTPRDCNEALHGNYRSIDEDRKSGVYYIQPSGGAKIQAYCDMATDGGGWTMVSELGRSTTNADDLSTESLNGFHRFKYELNNMGYDEVLVERVGAEWCDSWGMETKGKLIGKASMAISTDKKSIHYYSGAPPFKPQAKGWIKQSYAACTADPAGCWKKDNEDSSDIEVVPVAADEKKVKFVLPLTPGGAKYLEVENFNAFLGSRVLGNGPTPNDNNMYSCYMPPTDAEGRPAQYQQRVFIRKKIGTNKPEAAKKA